MVASTFGAAFDKLPRETQTAYAKMMRTRRGKYELAMRRGYSPTKIILLADTPGPGRPNTPEYHHTPFYSTKNSSFWLNKQLVDMKVDETDLAWFNTKLADGTPLDPVHVHDLYHQNPDLSVICLGNNAHKWFDTHFSAQPRISVFHPQAWKRFHAHEKYPLLGYLQLILDL